MLALLAILVLLQPPPPPASPPPLPPPADGVKPEPPKPALPQMIVNTGKPMLLEAVCANEEIHDFGLTCSEEDPCSVFLELSTVEPVGNKLFVAGNFHTEATTLWSVLLASEDAGKTWFEPFPRIRSGILDQIQFADFETGWISGHLALALPRDPFILKSGDGGKTWRRQPLGEEGSIAVIEQFSFENKNNGVLILDRSRAGEVRQRYHRLETSTGGDVWTLREATSKAIPGKRAKGQTSNSTEWRLSAEANKAYRVQQRLNNRWTTVASFALSAGSCKPAPPPPPPQAEEPPKPPPAPL